MNTLWKSLVLLLCLANHVGQSQNPLTQLETRYAQYQQTHREIKPRLLFAHHQFVSGDTVRVAAILLDRNNRPMTGTGLARLRVTAFNGRDVLDKMILLEGLLTPVVFALPADLPVGYYRTSIEVATGNQASVGSRLISVVDESDIVPVIGGSSYYAIEGGNLIWGRNVKLYAAFPVIHEVVQIQDQQGKTMAIDTTDAMGFACFNMAFERDQAYYSIHSNGREELNLQSLRVNNLQELLISRRPGNIFSIDRATGAMSQPDLYAVCVSSGKLVGAAALLAAQTTLVDLSGKWEPGHNQLTIIDLQGKVHAHYGFWVDGFDVRKVSAHWANPGSEERRINLSFKEFKPEKSLAALVSLINTSAIDTVNRPELLDEISGFAMACNRWPAISPSDRLGAWERYLALHDRPIQWESVLAPADVADIHGLSSYFNWSGRVYLDSAKSQRAPAGMPIAFLHEESPFFFQTTSQHDGLVTVSIPPSTYRDSYLYYHAMYRGKRQPVWIEWQQTQSYHRPLAPPDFKSGHAKNSYSQFQRRLSDIEMAYTRDNELKRPVQKSVNLPVRWIPDITINTENYPAFSSLPELAREIVPSLFVRQGRDKAIVRVSVDAPMIADDSPLFVINGRITSSVARFLSIPVSEVRIISVIKSPAKLGSLGILGKNGVVIVTTSKPVVVDERWEEHRFVPGVVPPSRGRIERMRQNRTWPFFSALPVWCVMSGSSDNLITAAQFLLTDDPVTHKIDVLTIDDRGIHYFRGEFAANTQQP